MDSPTVNLVVDAAVGLAIIAAAVVLMCLGKIDGQTGIALIGAGAALASGSSKSALALRVPAPAQPAPAPVHAATAVVVEPAPSPAPAPAAPVLTPVQPTSQA